MPDHSIEHYALKQLWATLRHSLAPELTSPLAKDRAKRADAAMLRLVAGYEQLPTLRAMYASRYSALLTEARLTKQRQPGQDDEPDNQQHHRQPQQPRTFLGRRDGRQGQRVSGRRTFFARLGMRRLRFPS